MTFDGSEVNLLIAFIGGTITFFASCLLPLVPVYLAYLSGIAVTKPIKDQHRQLINREVFINSLMFVIGFIAVFIALGVAASTLGKAVVLYQSLIQKIGGLFLISMSLFMLRIIHPAWLNQEFKIQLPKKQITKWRKLNSLLVGITFGLAWTPCVGPVLAVILFWASQAATFWQGSSLLLAYGIGLGIPFLIVGLLFEKISPKLTTTTQLGRTMHKIAAIIILITGILLIMGKLNIITFNLRRILNINTHAV